MASHLEETLARQLHWMKVPPPEFEYRFAAEHVGGPGKGLISRLEKAELKDWRFDFAWPYLKFAVEIEGGGWSGGRHTRGKGFADDLRKYEKAMLIGWVIYRCDGDMVNSGQAVRTIRAMIKQIAESA